MPDEKFPVENFTRKALMKQPLTASEIAALVYLRDEGQIARLKKGACQIRTQFFGNHVFLYGFVYFSTYCRNLCSFCNYAAKNKMNRYRKSVQEILAVCRSLQFSGVHLIDLTMGEDPHYLTHEGDALLELVKFVRSQVDLPLMLSPGVIGEHLLESLAELGVAWYACYQETYNPNLFQQLRVGQSFTRRLGAKQKAREANLLVEDGMLLHLGESEQDIISSILAMQRLGVHQARVMAYVPPEPNGLPKRRSHNLEEETVIAILRHVFPDRLIPASLDIEGLKGLSSRLKAGANVVSSIIPPMTGLRGVSQTTLDIDEGRRTVENVKEVLKSLNLEVAPLSMYFALVQRFREEQRMGTMGNIGEERVGLLL
ncbi:MAG: methylornithine synthase PylB [Dethiobacter sp.]|jgi:methylornithine synthase|nr:MAG: methylornithine synthase PylB [Dethiobacter sp.]